MLTARNIFIVAAFALLTVVTVSAYATDTHWIDGVGSWHDPANWDNGVPTTNDAAYVDNGGTAMITEDFSFASLSVGSGYVEQRGSNAWDNYPTLSIGGNGKYTLWDGSLYAWMSVGGQFDQFGGSRFGELSLGGTYNQYGGWNVSPPNGVGIGGIYNLYGGEFWTDYDEGVGGTFNQNSGAHRVSGILSVGGQYNMSGGSLFLGVVGGFLPTAGLSVGGTFNVTNSAASISISQGWGEYSSEPPSGRFVIENLGVWSAVPGTTVYMTESFFDNQSASETNLAGLSNTTFIFGGGSSESPDTFEIGGEDMGIIADGFHNNFMLYGLTLEGEFLQLVDGNDNGNRGGIGGEAEALYVERLILNEGSTLDLNGFHLYTAYFENNGGTVLNGHMNIVPEPGTAMLLATALLGLGGLIVRRMRGILLPLGVLALLGGLTVSAYATDTYWIHDAGSPGSSSDPINWDNGVPIEDGDHAYIDNGGTAQMWDGDEFGSPGTIFSLGPGQFDQFGGIIYGVVNVGGYGTYDQFGGEVCGFAGMINVNAGGVYNLYGGNAESCGEVVDGTFNQNGGGNHVDGRLYVGGEYNMSGGNLDMLFRRFEFPSGLDIGSTGTFRVTNNAANIWIGCSWLSSLGIANGGVWSAVPGTTLQMSDSPFINQSSSETDLAGLANTTFVFGDCQYWDGGPWLDTFEVAGVDCGAVLQGFAGNFAIDGLTLGGYYGPGHVRLVDGNDNGNRGGIGGEAEALYVERLILNEGSTLDLNGYHLYTEDYQNLGGTILNGHVDIVPEPGTLALIAPAVLGLAGISLRRAKKN